MLQKCSTTIHWDLLENFLLVAKNQSFRNAANQSGINHTTISRQLKKLETILGQPVFDRSVTGLTLNQMGQTIYSYVLQMEQHHLQLQHLLEVQGDTLSGLLTISMGDSLISSLGLPLRNLAEEHPHLDIVMHVSNELVSLDKGEADIAIRITDRPPEHLIGFPIEKVFVAAYISRKLLKSLKLPLSVSLEQVPATINWIRWQNSWGSQLTTPKVTSKNRAQKARFSTNSSAAMVDAVSKGLGAAFMVTNLADDNSDLIEIKGSRRELPYKVWLLYHPSSRQSPKVLAAVSAIKDFFESGRAGT